MTNAVSLSARVAEDIKTDCRVRAPKEACGFVVGPKETGAGTRIVAMRNAHPNPLTNYRMDPDDILAAYKGFDEDAEEVVAVYHSHVNGPPVLSSGRPDADVENAQDLTVAYIVVGLDSERAHVRAYRIKTPFVGVREPAQVPLTITPDGHPWQPKVPLLPWALATGNRVLIIYSSTGPSSGGIKSVTANVKGPDLIKGERATGVLLEPATKAGPERMVLDRIRSVKILEEGKEGREIRDMALRASRHLMSAISMGDDMTGLDKHTALLAAAFPSGFAIDPKGA